MKNNLIIILIIIAIAMIAIGVSAKILPPALTGVGFIVIGILFYKRDL